MLRFVTDVCFNGTVLRGLRRRSPHLDVIRAQDVELQRAPDPVLLQWAAEEGRLVLSHDVRTLIDYANDRTRSGLPMPGLIEVPRSMSIGQAVNDILVLAECSGKGEWEGQVIFLPL